MDEFEATWRSADRQGNRGGGDDREWDRPPRYREGEAPEGEGARRRGRRLRGWRAATARRLRGRRGPLLEVRRHRDQGRWRRRTGPARVRCARQGRLDPRLTTRRN